MSSVGCRYAATCYSLKYPHRFPQLKFQYRDPEKNFDRSKVHGLVAKLVKVKDPSTATALEVAAGGKVSGACVMPPSVKVLLPVK